MGRRIVVRKIQGPTAESEGASRRGRMEAVEERSGCIGLMRHREAEDGILGAEERHREGWGMVGSRYSLGRSCRGFGRGRAFLGGRVGVVEVLIEDGRRRKMALDRGATALEERRMANPLKASHGRCDQIQRSEKWEMVR